MNNIATFNKSNKKGQASRIFIDNKILLDTINKLNNGKELIKQSIQDGNKRSNI